jgi:hypothetical protein
MKINCKESAVRTSDLRDRKLRGIRKVELWYHLAICKFCRIYNKQINKLGRISRLIGDPSCGLEDRAGESSHVELSEAAKSRIKKKLQA